MRFGSEVPSWSSIIEAFIEIRSAETSAKSNWPFNSSDRLDKKMTNNENKQDMIRAGNFLCCVVRFDINQSLIWTRYYYLLLQFFLNLKSIRQFWFNIILVARLWKTLALTAKTFIFLYVLLWREISCWHDYSNWRW